VISVISARASEKEREKRGCERGRERARSEQGESKRRGSEQKERSLANLLRLIFQRADVQSDAGDGIFDACFVRIVKDRAGGVVHHSRTEGKPCVQINMPVGIRHARQEK
jgi:hypothetical protein